MRYLLLAAAFVISLTSPSGAKSPSAPFEKAIQDAARVSGSPNRALAATVVRLIGANPSQLEQIVATATAAAPAERIYVVRRVERAFPAFKGRLSGSQAPTTEIVQAPSTNQRPMRANSQMMLEEQSAWYADIGVGLLLVQDTDLTDPALGGLTGTLSSDIGFMGSGSFGYKFSRNFRGEAEFGFRNSGLDSLSVGGFGLGATSSLEGSVSVISLLANGYVDFPLNDKFVAFGGGGIGAAAINVDIENNATDEWDTVFAYQLAAGFRFELLERAWVRATYKFFGTSDPKINTTEGEFFSHAVEVGYYYEF